MTIAADLLALKRIQVACRNAIEAMGVSVGDAPFATYPDLIMRIEAERATVIDGSDDVFDGANRVVAFSAA